MANFDLLFFDVDGTLAGPDHFSLPLRNRRALRAAREAGVRLAIATGRCRCILPSWTREAGFDYAITSCGAAIDDLQTGERLYRRCFDLPAARIACRAAERETDFFELFSDGEILLTAACAAKTSVRPLPPWHKAYFDQGRFPTVPTLSVFLDGGAPNLEKINLVCCDNAAIARVDKVLRPTGLFQLSSGMGNGYEVLPVGCTKGAAIQWLCARLGVSPERTAALGDGGNDIEMLRAAGCGVAMGNAGPAVRAAADVVAAPYDQDGAARFIEEYVL